MDIATDRDGAFLQKTLRVSILPRQRPDKTPDHRIAQGLNLPLAGRLIPPEQPLDPTRTSKKSASLAPNKIASRAGAEKGPPAQAQDVEKSGILASPSLQHRMLTMSHSLWTSASDSCLQFIRFSIHCSSVDLVAGSVCTGDTSAGTLPTSSIFVSMVEKRSCGRGESIGDALRVGEAEIEGGGRAGLRFRRGEG